jgi:hypothetical protein
VLELATLASNKDRIVQFLLAGQPAAEQNPRAATAVAQADHRQRRKHADDDAAE